MVRRSSTGSILVRKQGFKYSRKDEKIRVVGINFYINFFMKTILKIEPFEIYQDG